MKGIGTVYLKKPIHISPKETKGNWGDIDVIKGDIIVIQGIVEIVNDAGVKFTLPIDSINVIKWKNKEV